jgi:predicted dehydrogenase
MGARIGLVGLGEIARQRHLPVLAQHPRWRVTVAAETDPDRAARVAAAFSIPRIASDAVAVIESKDVDVVAILTPPDTHAELARAALDAGKHVFVEKPLALASAQAQALADRAGQGDPKLLVGFNLRHHPHIRQAREWIRAGRVGRVRAVHSTLANVRPPAAAASWRGQTRGGGDPLFELGVHHFDLTRFLFDAEIVQVSAQEWVSPQARATVQVALRLANGALVTTTLVEDTVEHNAFEIIGERGRLVLSLYRFDGVHWFPRGQYDGGLGLRWEHTRQALGRMPRLISRRSGGDFVGTYRAEWDHLYDVIANGTPPLATAADGAAATRIAEDARRALNGG